VRSQYASLDFFQVLGLEAELGRTFVTDLEAVEATEVVLSSRYWRSRFGGDPNVIGRSLQLNATPVVVVGVMSPDYVVFGENIDLWAGIKIDRGDQTNSGRWLMVIGRLSDGVAIEAARGEIEAISASLREEFPEFNAGWSVNLVPLKQQVVGDVQQGLWILLGAVGLLLLIACANVANLFLVRATERQKEMAVRTSLGATGRALAGQLFTESVLIAGAGATIGIALAHFGTRVIASRMPAAFAMPRVESAGVDGPVLLFAVALTGATAILFGLLPALQAARTSPSGTLNAESRGPSRRSGAIRNSLVVGEVAISVVLLSAAALFGRSFFTLMSVDPGIEAERVLVGRVNLSGDTYPTAEPKVAFFDDLIARVAAQPGVDAVGAVTFLPMDGQGAATNYWPMDRPQPADQDRRPADIRNVAGDYFGAMGIQLLRGRTFDSRDAADGPQTMIINRATADLYWPDGDALGQQIAVNWVDEEPWEVIAVVENVHMAGLDTEPREVFYLHYAKATFFPWMHVAVRATGDPALLAATLRAQLAEFGPRAPARERAPDGRPRADQHRAPPNDDHVDDGVRRTRDVTRGGRSLWCSGLYRVPARAGDRRADRPRCSAR